MRVVFCGTAAGAKSARVGAYYAGPGIGFWGVLERVGLTPRVLSPSEFRELPLFGIGLTDLAKTTAGSDADISASELDVEATRVKIEHFAPMALAYNGKRAAEDFLRRAVEVGRQNESVGGTAIFVLPSTSRCGARILGRLALASARGIRLSGRRASSPGHVRLGHLGGRAAASCALRRAG